MQSPAIALLIMVAAILWVERQSACRPLFRWLPVPLWCYALPMIAVTSHLLPQAHPAYGTLTSWLLPLALGCLLLGVDLPAIAASGGTALAAAVVGAVGIMGGTALGVRLLQSHLPSEAWKGAGALAATWTGGTMNLLSMRSMLQVPEAVFAPLIVVDAAVAYSWMALLVAASAIKEPLNRWLRASSASSEAAHASAAATSRRGRATCACLACAAALTLIAHAASSRLPTSTWIASASGWTVLLVTTGALLGSLMPAIRRVGTQGSGVGYLCLYLVLAATGAQANLEALRSAPAWLLVGGLVAVLHGGLLLLFGRLWRIPLGMLATASQANIGGVVSAPMVGAVYDQSLAPVGLLLAMAGNAVGTYLGLCSATLARWLTR